MNKAEELLNSMSTDILEQYSASDKVNGHIVIDNHRHIHIPEYMRKLGVQYDHNVETVPFDCPRYWDEHDLSTMTLYINYRLSNGYVGSYEIGKVTVDIKDSSIIHFNWTISGNVTQVKGKVQFLVCAVSVNEDGDEEIHWNSELSSDAYISEGLETRGEELARNSDIVTSLLLKMDTILTADSYIVDKTLTESNLAADAKATGEAIERVNAELKDEVTKLSKSIADNSLTNVENVERLGNELRNTVSNLTKAVNVERERLDNILTADPDAGSDEFKVAMDAIDTVDRRVTSINNKFTDTAITAEHIDITRCSNMFDMRNSVRGYWYPTTTTLGDIVDIESNQYTTEYLACYVDIRTRDFDSITISVDCPSGCKIINALFTDENGVLLHKVNNESSEVTLMTTLTVEAIPTEATMMCFSVVGLPNGLIIWVNDGSKQLEYEPYSEDKVTIRNIDQPEIHRLNADVSDIRHDLKTVLPFNDYTEQVVCSTDTTNNILSPKPSSTICGMSTYMTKEAMFGNAKSVNKIILNKWNIEGSELSDTLVVELRCPSLTGSTSDSYVVKSYESDIIVNGICDYEINCNIYLDDLDDLPNEFIFGVYSKSQYRMRTSCGSKNNIAYDKNGNAADETGVKCKYLGYYLQRSNGPCTLGHMNIQYASDIYRSPVISFYTDEYVINFADLKDDLNNDIANVELKLPEKFDLVVGDTFELFYKGIINALDSDYYDFEFSFSGNTNFGSAYKRFYTVTPTSSDVGTKKMTITVRDNTGTIITSGSTVLNIIKSPSSVANNKVVLCIGDSLSSSGYWQNELNRRLTGTDGSPAGLGLNNIQFVGTKQYGNTKYEGYGGWRFSHYLSESSSLDFMNIFGTFDKTDADQHSVYADSNGVKWKLETIGLDKIKIIRVDSNGMLPNSGTLTWVSGGDNHSSITYSSSEQAPGNPFWNAETNQNDFIAYANRMGVNSIDYVYILLGWNNTGDTKLDYMTKCMSFINGILDAFPNCKIGLIGLQVPSRDGFAKNYGTGWKFYDKLQFVWNLQDWYIKLTEQDHYAGKVDYINLSGQFDTEYGYPTQTRKVNARSSITETYQSNGVHPTADGYMQIADAIYRNICAKLASI